MEISKSEAEQILTADLAYYVAQTVKLCPTLALAPAAVLAAIADFTFNLGVGRLRASTLRRRINAGEWDEVPYELRRWVKGAGRVLPGLVARREAEIALFETRQS
jgi:lysozyme